MMILALHRPVSKTSKANLCFDALAKAYHTVNNYDKSVNSAHLNVFWGLVENNSSKIKFCVDNRIPWLFVDMPYWHRWTNSNLDWSINNAHWRFVPGAFHPTEYHQFDNNRLSDIEVKLTKLKSSNKVLICPSSDTLTRHCLGIDSATWVQQTIKQAQTQFPHCTVAVRHKPRNAHTSGPDAAKISIEDDLTDCCAVVSLASIAAIDAATHSIPVYHTHQGYSPAQPISNELTILEHKHNSSQQWLNTLSNYQYSLKEIAANKLDDILKCYLQ